MNKLQILKFVLSILLLSLPSVGKAEEDQIIKIGNAPNLWWAQPSIIIGEGWDREVGIKLELKKYPGPAHLLQAFVQGELDGMNNNIAAGILTYSKGIPIELVSGTFIGDINLLSEGELVELKNKYGLVEAIKKFSQLKQRKLKLGTNPKGSLSDLNSKFWLKTNMPDYKNYIDTIHAGDQAQLQQLLIMGQADLLAGFAPIKEIVSQKNPNISFFLTGKELMKNQPGGALIMRTSYIEAHSERIKQLKELYLRATSLMKSDPERCAVHIEKYLLQGLLKKEVINEVLINSKDYLSTDLELVKPNTQKIHDLMLEEGYIKESINLDLIF
jgi:NitT/TauT family transport system substrate-binding protein